MSCYFDSFRSEFCSESITGEINLTFLFNLFSHSRKNLDLNEEERIANAYLYSTGGPGDVTSLFDGLIHTPES